MLSVGIYKYMGIRDNEPVFEDKFGKTYHIIEEDKEYVIKNYEYGSMMLAFNVRNKPNKRYLRVRINNLILPLAIKLYVTGELKNPSVINSLKDILYKVYSSNRYIRRKINLRFNIKFPKLETNIIDKITRSLAICIMCTYCRRFLTDNDMLKYCNKRRR